MNPTSEGRGRAPRSEEGWKRLLVFFIAGCTFLSAVFGFLHVDAGCRAARADRDARSATLRAVAKSSAAIVRYSYERERLAAFQSLAAEWLIERDRALAAAESGADDEATARVQSAGRLLEVMEVGRALSTVLSPPYFDEATFAADVVQFNVDYFTVPSLHASEEDEALRAESTAWGDKAGRYVVCLTVIAVSAFLFALAMTLRGALRRLFTAVGSAIALTLVGVTCATVLSSVPRISMESLTYYADAAGHLTYVSYVAPLGKREIAVERTARAIDLATRAIDLRPDYAAAYELRAMARLLAVEESLSPFAPLGFAAAVADFDRALALGRDSASLEDLRARALFFSGRTDDALVAERRALALSPEQRLRFGLHLAILLLGAGQEAECRREAESALVYAEAHPMGSDPVTFREAILILDRLTPLGWPGRESLQARIKEAFVSLTHLGRATPPPLTARAGRLTFSSVGDDTRETSFPSGTRAVRMRFDVADLAAGSSLVVRVSLDGVEQPSLGWSEIWAGTADATLERTIGVLEGRTIFDLLAGSYAVEVYLDGALAGTGAFAVQ